MCSLNFTEMVTKDHRLWFGLCCLMPLSTNFSYIVAVSFISGEDRSTRRKPPTCRKSLTNFITYWCTVYVYVIRCTGTYFNIYRLRWPPPQLCEC